MKIENKYYTPEIIEIHHDFECEVFFENKWNSCIAQIHEGELCVIKGFPKKLVKYVITEETIENKNIRVKYLDREDIIDCGWHFSNLAQKFCIIDKDADGEINKGLWLDIIGNKIQIIDSRFTIHNVLFFGAIKNKSELIILMKQLNISL